MQFPARTFPMLLALALAASVPVVGSGGQAVAAGVELPIVASMRSHVQRLQAGLGPQRKQVVAAARTASLAESRVALLGAGRDGVRELAGVMPVLRGQLLDVVDDDSYAATAEAAAAGERDDARNKLDAATEEAAATQADLSDAERRLAALRHALDSQSKGPAVADADIVIHRWGGPQTAPVSAAMLDQYLASKASPIASEGAALMRAGLRYNIDPRLVVAIAGAESYFGLQTCAAHNAWGWGCPSGPFAFRSWAEGIETVAQGLRENYLDEGRTTVDEIHAKYAPLGVTNDPENLNYAWANNVARFLQEQGGNPNNVEGDAPATKIDGR